MGENSGSPSDWNNSAGSVRNIISGITSSASASSSSSVASASASSSPMASSAIFSSFDGTLVVYCQVLAASVEVYQFPPPLM